MPDRSFELIFPFHEFATPDGYRTYPIVQVEIISPDGTVSPSLPLLVDTGADVTVLRRELFPLLGLASWDQGREVGLSRVGDENDVAQAMYEYDDIPLVICGEVIPCTVALTSLANEGFYQGLLGRQHVFPRFGFGFWESTRQLLITVNP